MLNAKIITLHAEAPWVVFLHGFGGSSDTWLKQTEAYNRRYNLMLINFHHPEDEKLPLTVESFCTQISETMSGYGVSQAHVVSISSGSLVAFAFASLYPEKVKAMVLAGGMLSFNLFTTFLLMMARILQHIVPYMMMYRFFAYIIMPKNNHKKSREIFAREAKKLGHVEFCRWVSFISLLKNNKPFIQRINNLKKKMPLLYIMGAEDHLFKHAVIKDITGLKDATVQVIPKCGHVCSIEKAEIFNQISLDFFAESEQLLGHIS